MTSYAQFYIKYNNNIQEKTGSDGILPLDNRFNLFNKIKIVKNYLNSEKTNYICKFEIRQCNSTSPFKNYKIIYSENLSKESI